MTGTIKTKTDRGFGFIKAEGIEKDLFFHSDACKEVPFDELQVNETVSFETEDSDRGPRAVNVKRV